MENHEDYLDALNAYGRNPDAGIPPVLEQYLNGVAKNGETLFQWQLLKPLIEGKMEQVIGELRQGLSSETIPPRPNVENVVFDVMHSRIMSALHKFSGAPFTIQRICELLIDPKRHYLRSDKFMRGLEKNVLVVSTVDPFGRKVVSESNKPLVNGMDINGSPFSMRDPHTSTPLPPVPDWITSTTAIAVASVTSVVTSVLEKMGTPAHTTSCQDSSVQGISTEEGCMSSNSISSGLVSSLYTDQGEQPMAVHAEEVVEETVVTMETNEVASVATDGGESLALSEMEEVMGNEDTNASSSSSSSSSSEDMVAQEITVPVLTSKVSSSTGSPKSRPWAALTEEESSDKLQDILSTSAEASTQGTELSDACSSTPSTSESDSSHVTQPLLSWQPISTSQEQDTSSISFPITSQEAPEYALELVTPSSTVADTVTVSSAISENVEESPVLDLNLASNEAQQVNVDVSVVDANQGLNFVTDLGAETPDCNVPTSATDCDPSITDQVVCSDESEACPSETVTVYTASDPHSYMECDSVAGMDSVAGLERLVCSVEPSSVSPPSHSTLGQMSSPSSSSSLCHNSSSLQNNTSPNSSLPTQSDNYSEDCEPKSKRSKLSEGSECLDMQQIISSGSQDTPSETPESAENTQSDIPDTAELTDTRSSLPDTDMQVDSTADQPAESESPSAETESGDFKVKEETAMSPPSHKSSTDSTGFETASESIKPTEEDNSVVESGGGEEALDSTDNV